MAGIPKLLKRTPATKTSPGAVKMMPLQADSTAATNAALVADFNALLAKLRAAGILSTT